MIGFVPDHLGFPCTKGVEVYCIEGLEVYRVTVPPFQTTYVIPRVKDKTDQTLIKNYSSPQLTTILIQNKNRLGRQSWRQLE